MLFWMYQQQSKQTAIYPGKGSIQGLLYTTLGLAGEAGEVANKVKKILRDGGGVITQEMKLAIGKELGDVLWYTAETCEELGLDMSQVAHENIVMLRNRAIQDKIKGSGDDR